jgi:ABC-type amino acid transport substrate-binding protein
MSEVEHSLYTILDRGTVRISATWDKSWEQYLDPNTGRPSGMVGLVGQQLASDLGVEPEFVHSAWSEQLSNLGEGLVDVCLKHTNLPNRAVQVRFVSTPLLSYRGVIFVHDAVGDIGVAEFARSKSGRFAVTRGSLHGELAAEVLPRWERVETASASESFESLLVSQVDTVVTDDIVTNPQGTHPLRSPGGEDVVISRDASYPSVRHRDESWFRWVENWMRYTRTQGTLDKLIHQSKTDYSSVAESF